jgi:integrase
MTDERGEGRVFLQPRSRFYAYCFYLDGTRHRGSTGETDRQRAWKIMQKKRAEVLRGDSVPHEDKVTLGDLFKLLEGNYELRRNRSIDSMRYSFKHLRAYFTDDARATKLGARVDGYVTARRQEGAADATLRIELALLDRAFKLAVQKRLISQRSRPYIEKPAEDPSHVRKGFFTREQVEALAAHLPAPLADLVLFLFFSAWRVGEARALEWKHVFAVERAIRLPAELHKNKKPKALPIAGDLAAIMERRLAARDLTCPYVFHRNGRRIGDFRKLWAKACTAIGVSGRIVHDLRRSGVKHLIETPGNDPHTVMAFSGHSTPSMLRRYHIIDLDVMRQAAERASARRSEPGTVTPLHDRPTSALPH